MVKAGTEFVSFSFSKTFVMQGKKKLKNHKCQHVATSWLASNPTKNKCSTPEELEKAKQVTQRAAWPSSPCFWLKAALNSGEGVQLWGCGGRAQVQEAAVSECPAGAKVGAGTEGALWANRAAW